jgi:hypothetical protein
MERRSSTNEFEHSPDAQNIENSAEKKSVAEVEVGSEHRVHLEGLRFHHDHTRRKLKV